MNDVAELEDFYEDFKITQIKSYLYKFITRGGKIWVEQVKLMKLILTILSKEFMPFEKKIELIAKGRPLFVTNQEWEILSKWSNLEKGDSVI